jgi:hypothetical protein
MAEKGVMYMAFGIAALGLVLLVMLINLKPRPNSGLRCRACGKLLVKARIDWHYQLPFEVWAVVARNQLNSSTLQRFVCPDWHTQTWYIPKHGDRQTEVWVTKTLKG